MQRQATRTNTGAGRARRRALAQVAVIIAIVASAVGSSYAWAMMYYSVDYAWYDRGAAGREFHIKTPGELEAFSTIVNGTWGSMDADQVKTPLADATQARLRASAAKADDFAGATVYLDASLGFAGVAGAASEDRPTLTPIGTQGHPFNGTFDGGGNSIVGLRISNLVEDNVQGDNPDSLPPLQYAGLFGHVGADGKVKDLALGRNCSVALAGTEPSDHIAYVGSVAGYCEGSLDNVESQAQVSIVWDDGKGGDGRYKAGDYANAYVVDGVGGIAGYCDGSISNAAFKGSVSVSTPANAAWVVESQSNEATVVRYVGGVVGRSGGDPAGAGIADESYGTLTGCTNSGDVTVATIGAGGQDRFGETVDSKSQYVGGIAGYAIGDIARCTNSGAIVASSYVYDKNKSETDNLRGYWASDGGADSCGGIVGGFRSAGSVGLTDTVDARAAANREAFYLGGGAVDRGLVGASRSNGSNAIAITDCTNLGSVISCNNVGGIAGSTGTNTRVDGCANGDAKKYRMDDTVGSVMSVRWNKPNTGGLVGRCYGDVAYSRNHGEVSTSKGGYYVGGLAGNLYFYRDAGGKKISTPEVYGCYSTGQIATTNTFRRGALLGGNGGYIHDCLYLYGTATASEDEEVAAIGYALSQDSPVATRISVAYASDSQAAQHGSEAFSMKSSQAVAWLNNNAMKSDPLHGGDTAWETERYYLATPAANSGYPVLKSSGAASNTTIDLSKLSPLVELVADASYTTAFNPTPKLSVTVEIAGETRQLVENADYYVVPDKRALNGKGVCKGTSNGREYTAGACGIGNYMGSFGSVDYAVGKGSFEECSIDAVSSSYTGEPHVYEAGKTGGNYIQVNVVDAAGELVDPGDYTITVNDGIPCTNPGTYSIVANASANSYYAGKCAGGYAIRRLSIAKDCDVIGLVYDEAADGGIEDAADLGIAANPRVWFYNDEVYKLYEVQPVGSDASGKLLAYAEDDIKALKAARDEGQTMRVAGEDQRVVDPDTPDAVLEALVGAPKVKGLRVYREEGDGRFLTAATPLLDADADGIPDEYGMAIEYTAGELKPQVIGVNWAQGKLGRYVPPPAVSSPMYQVVYPDLESGAQNIESSVKGSVTVARFGSWVENYDNLTFGITQAEIDDAKKDRLHATMSEATQVFKVGDAVNPEVIVTYNGNVVSPANYELSITEVVNDGEKVARRSDFQEGDTISYQVVFKKEGSILCSTPLSGPNLTCTVVEDKKPLSVSNIKVEFDERQGWTEKDGVWTGTFDLETGIPKPEVTVSYKDGDDWAQLVEGADYVLSYSDWWKPGDRNSTEDERAIWYSYFKPQVCVTGRNEYAGTYHCYYRINRGVIDQGQLTSIASGEIDTACIANLRERPYFGQGPTFEEWRGTRGPYFPYVPDGYTKDELAERLGIAFYCKPITLAGVDFGLFAVQEIRDAEGKVVDKAGAIGTYTLKVKRTSQPYYGKFQTWGNTFFDVAEGATAEVKIQVVKANLTEDVYRDNEGNSLVLYMFDRGSAYLTQGSTSSSSYLYDRAEYAYTGRPVQPVYFILDGHLPSPHYQKITQEDGTTRLETHDEVFERLRKHAFSFDDYEAVIEGYAEQGGPVEPGTGYQVLKLVASENAKSTLAGTFSIFTGNLPINVFSVVAADISDPNAVGIRVGDEGAVNDSETNVGWLGNGGAKPSVHFYVDMDGNGEYDVDEECAYVQAAEGVDNPDYAVEYFGNGDITEGATATARVTILNNRHLVASQATGTDDWGHAYFDVHFRVEGRTVALDDPEQVKWKDIPKTLVLADDAAGTLSAPSAVASYQQGEEDVVIPETAYELVVGVVGGSGQGETFREQAGGWSAGDKAAIAVKAGSQKRFVMQGESPYVIARDVPVSKVDADHSFAEGSNISVALDAYDFSYDGKPHEPRVAASVGEAELRQDVDYRVSYSGNTLAGAPGAAKVTVQGIGAYAGSRTVSFTVSKRDLSSCRISAKPAAFTGEQVRPSDDEVTVELDGRLLTRTLASDTGDLVQWRVSERGYGDNVNAGTGTLTVEATDSGNFSGSVQVDFDIVGTPLSTCVFDSPQPDKALASGKRAFSIGDFKAGDIRLKDLACDAYLSLGTDFAVVGVEHADGYDNVKGESGSTSYLGFATVTLAGAGNYSGSASVDVPIQRKSIAEAEVSFEGYDAGALPSLEYTGKQLKPALEVKLAGEVLEAGTDYQATYRNNQDIGKATVTVKGTGLFEGQAATTLGFEIVPANVGESGASLTLAADSIGYTGEAVEPSCALTLKGERISARNVQLSYVAVSSGEDGAETLVPLASAPVELGTYRVTATAVDGNLRGQASADFTIVKADLADLAKAGKLVASNARYAFGDPVITEIAIARSDGSLMPLDASEGCTVSSSSATGTWNVGDRAVATVTAGEASPHFVGSALLEFSVGRIPIARGDVSPEEDASFPHTGADVRPDVVIVVDGRTLREGVDYEVRALSDDLASPGAKVLEISTPTESVYEAKDLIISYEVEKKPEPTLVVPGGGGDAQSAGVPADRDGADITVAGNVYRLDTKTMTAKLVSVSKGAKTLSVPAAVRTNTASYKVTEIGAAAVKARTKLTKVTGCANVVAIGKGAFQGCKKLKAFTVGKNVKSIGAKAFKACNKLKALTVKSAKLTKKGVKNSLAGSRVKTVKLSGKAAKKKSKAYKIYFKAANVGRAVRVR